MNVDSNIDKLLLLLSNAKSAAPKGCSEMYCSTCGGFGGYIECNLKDEDKALISYILENASFDHLERLHRWLQLISRIANRALATAYCRLAADVDMTNIEAIDKLIFRSGKYVCEEVRHSDKDYQALIQQAITLGIATQNSSSNQGDGATASLERFTRRHFNRLSAVTTQYSRKGTISIHDLCGRPILDLRAGIDP